jgi:hypothetical protein
MSATKRFSVLRDPVHGDVYLTHEELRLLDTAEMQRLRGVKQLGTAYLVYPGALHTRFDHSIGTLHMTRLMIEAMRLNAGLDPRGCLGVGEEEERIIRFAALLHDVTHIPFGHNIEDQTGLFHRHDSAYRFERMLDAHTDLGKELERLGAQKDVLAILTAERGARTPPYWSQVVSDTICSDILDYLQRDAYFSGLKLQIDPRLASYFKVDRPTGNLFIDLAKRELLREDILSEVVRMLEARYYFSERVYYHHAKVSAGALVARAVELAVGAQVVAEEDFYSQTDAGVLDLLERQGARAAADVRERIQRLVGRFRGRRLLKRACVFPRYANEEAQKELVARFFAPGRRAERQAVEERIADLVRFATGRAVEIIVYCPAARMQLKEVETHVRWPGEAAVRSLADFAARVPRLADLERSYRDLWKFYVFADASEPKLLQRVQEIACQEFPGATNVYRIEGA